MARGMLDVGRGTNHIPLPTERAVNKWCLSLINITQYTILLFVVKERSTHNLFNGLNKLLTSRRWYGTV